MPNKEPSCQELMPMVTSANSLVLSVDMYLFIIYEQWHSWYLRVLWVLWLLSFVTQWIDKSMQVHPSIGIRINPQQNAWMKLVQKSGKHIFFQICVPSWHIDTGRESNYNIGSTGIVEYCMGGELSGILYPTWFKS